MSDLRSFEYKSSAQTTWPHQYILAITATLQCVLICLHQDGSIFLSFKSHPAFYTALLDKTLFGHNTPQH